MATPKGMKLYHAVVPDTDEHKAIVHAYYHLLRSERGVRAAEGLREMYGSENRFVWYWEEQAIDHYIAFQEQIYRIPGWQEYLDARLEIHAERRLEKMYRDVSDEARKSYPEAEKAAARARRELNAGNN